MGSPLNKVLLKKLSESSNNDGNSGGGVIALVFVGIFVLGLVILAVSYFGKFFCPRFGYKCPSSPAPGPSSSGGPGSSGGGLLQTVDLNLDTRQTQQSGTNADQQIDCQGHWNATGSGFNAALGCSQPCYDAGRNIVGTQVQSFTVTTHPSQNGRQCLDVAKALNPGVNVTEDPVTHNITSDPIPCNRDTPCMVNCSLSDTYSTIAGYDTGSSGSLCSTGLIPVQASFTVTPTPPFYNATCSFIVENAHAVPRTACPAVAPTGGRCNSGWSYKTQTPVQDASRDWGATQGSGAGCWYLDSYTVNDRYGHALSTTVTWKQDNSQLLALTCPQGYTADTPLTKRSCVPIQDWYKCAPGEYKVPSISAQNGQLSSTSLPGCAPCPAGQTSDGTTDSCH